MKNLKRLAGFIFVLSSVSINMLHAQQTGNIRNADANSQEISPQLATPQCHAFAGHPS